MIPDQHIQTEVENMKELTNGFRESLKKHKRKLTLDFGNSGNKLGGKMVETALK